jgi:hypothetical protein
MYFIHEVIYLFNYTLQVPAKKIKEIQAFCRNLIFFSTANSISFTLIYTVKYIKYFLTGIITR